jgi:drug/metabolite transporter (DMT)-like permease
MPTAVLTLLLFLVTAVWGWTFVVVKEAIGSYGVLGFLAVRFTIGAVALAPFAARRVDRQALRVGMPIGLLLAAAYLLQTFGLRFTTATNGGLITGLFVILGPLANRLFFGVGAGRVFWAAAAVSVFGLFLLTGGGGSAPRLGDYLTFGCAAGFGLHIALLDRFAKGQDALALTIVQVATAAATYWVVWPFAEPATLAASSVWPSGAVWRALLLMGVIATAAGYYIQVLAQQRISAVRTAIILSLEPAFATFFGCLLAHDRLGGVQIAGAILMISAVMMSEITANRNVERNTFRSAP